MGLRPTITIKFELTPKRQTRYIAAIHWLGRDWRVIHGLVPKMALPTRTRTRKVHIPIVVPAFEKVQPAFAETEDISGLITADKDLAIRVRQRGRASALPGAISQPLVPPSLNGGPELD